MTNGSDFRGLHGPRMAKDKTSKSSHKQKQTEVPSNVWLVRSPPPQQPLPPDNAYEAEIPFRESRSSEEDNSDVKSIAEERSDEKSEPDTASNASSAIALKFLRHALQLPIPVEDNSSVSQESHVPTCSCCSFRSEEGIESVGSSTHRSSGSAAQPAMATDVAAQPLPAVDGTASMHGLLFL